jgi:hypothetical protein
LILSCKFLGPVRRAGDVPLGSGRGDLVNRLARPHSAAHVEAPDPDIIMRRVSRPLGKDHDPSDGINAIALRFRELTTHYRAGNRFASRARPISATRLAPMGRALPLCRMASKGRENLTSRRN